MRPLEDWIQNYKPLIQNEVKWGKKTSRDSGKILFCMEKSLTLIPDYSRLATIDKYFGEMLLIGKQMVQFHPKQFHMTPMHIHSIAEKLGFQYGVPQMLMYLDIPLLTLNQVSYPNFLHEKKV